ncbi:DUF3630 family protein [Thalassotalea ganghwensis]
MYTINAIEYLPSHAAITLTVNGIDWQTETICLAFEGFISNAEFQLLEIIKGADKVMARFLANNYEFCLHAEFYSEAIWIEASDDGSAEYLSHLAMILAHRIVEQG